MPRVPDELLEAVVFLYPNEEAAKKGEKAGGTGFFASVRSEVLRRPFIYLVTNLHVASRDLVARGNTKAGFGLLRFPKAAWVHHPDGDDVAAAAVDIPDDWQVTALEWESYGPTPARMKELNVGIGDETVMVGRFIGHEGQASNQPVARFGNIALMPGERIIDARGIRVEAYLIEMRSLPGFSGSPVFVYIGPASYRGNKTMMPFYSETIGLVGIDTGHKQESASIFDKETGKMIPQPWEVRQNSGVAIVAPYWKIKDVLDEEVFVRQREVVDKQ